MHTVDDVALSLMVVVFMILVLIVIRQAELMAMARAILARTGSLATEDEQELITEISSLIGRDRTRHAIRLYREKYGASLADAASTVESIARRKEA